MIKKLILLFSVSSFLCFAQNKSDTEKEENTIKSSNINVESHKITNSKKHKIKPKQILVFHNKKLLLVTNNPDDLKKFIYLSNIKIIIKNYNSRYNKYLSILKKFQSLEIECSDIKNSDLRDLSTLKNLTVLYLSFYNTITEKGLKYLADFKTLKELNIGLYINGKNTSLKYLSNKKNIRFLDLYFCEALTNNSLKHISKLNKLEYLNLSNSLIRDENLRYLASLDNLRTLNLSFCFISNRGLQYISKLKNLEDLSLRSCNYISNTGLRYMSKLKQLKRVDIRGCKKLTKKGIKFYKKRLKHIHIID